MYYIVITLIALLTGFFIGRKRKITVECEHDFERTFSTCENLDLLCKHNGSDIKNVKDINVLYSVCLKCKYELIIVGDGTYTTFSFNKEIYLEKMRQLRKDNELKYSMKIQV